MGERQSTVEGMGMKIPPLIPKIKVPEDMEFPVIDPVPVGVERPFWSVMVPTLNRADYLERCLKSVLDQGIGPNEMQIEVVDNCSTVGDTEALVERIGGGRIEFYRQPQRVIPNDQGTTCMRRARGLWVHVLHDDDMVMPGFYQAYRQFIEKHPEVTLVHNRPVTIDEHDDWKWLFSTPGMNRTGIVENAKFELVRNCFIVTPSAAVARQAFEEVGGVYGGLAYLADWELWMRIATTGAIGYIHQPYFLYRQYHAGSESGKSVSSGKWRAEALTTIEIGTRRLPNFLQNHARRAAYAREADNARVFRSMLHMQMKHGAAVRYALYGFRLSPSARSFGWLLRSSLIAVKSKMLWGWRDRSPRSYQFAKKLLRRTEQVPAISRH